MEKPRPEEAGGTETEGQGHRGERQRGRGVHGDPSPLGRPRPRSPVERLVLRKASKKT